MQRKSRRRLITFAPLLIALPLLFVVFWYARSDSPPIKSGQDDAEYGTPEAQPTGPKTRPEAAGPTAPKAGNEGSETAANRLRSIVYETSIQRKEPWSSRHWMNNLPYTFMVPLPEDEGFWDLVARIRSEFGDRTPDVLMEAISKAESERFQELYAAVLTALRDPAAEGSLRSLAADDSGHARVRAVALYGLGLIGSESSWDTVVDFWNRTMDRDESTVGLLAAVQHTLGLYGVRALPLLVEESRRHQDGWGLQALMALKNATTSVELVAELRKLVEEPPTLPAEFGAIAALAHHADADTLRFLIGRALESDDRMTARMILNSIAQSNRQVPEDLYSDPGELSRILSLLAEASEAVQLDAIWLLPQVRRAMPEALESIELPETDMGMWVAYVRAAVADPSAHDRLAEMLSRNPKVLWMLDASFFDPAEAITNPKLLEVIENAAVDASHSQRSFNSLWKALEHAPESLRARAAARIQGEYKSLETMVDRFQYARFMHNTGPEVTPHLLDLLEWETDPLAQMELTSAIFSNPGALAADAVLTRVRARLKSQIDELLAGKGMLDPGYVVAHPGRHQEGLPKYIGLIRDLAGAFGTPEDIPAIRNFATFVTDPEFSEADASRRKWAKDLIHRGVVESVDMILARHWGC